MFNDEGILADLHQPNAPPTQPFPFTHPSTQLQPRERRETQGSNNCRVSKSCMRDLTLFARFCCFLVALLRQMILCITQIGLASLLPPFRVVRFCCSGFGRPTNPYRHLVASSALSTATTAERSNAAKLPQRPIWSPCEVIPICTRQRVQLCT